MSQCHDIATDIIDLNDTSRIEATFQGVDARLGAVMLLAKAVVSSLSNVTPSVVKVVQDALELAEIIELVTRQPLLSLLHRLQVFREAASES